MEIGGLRYPRELHVDTKEERLKNIVVFCADSLLGSIDNRLTRKSGEGQEEWLMHKQDAAVSKRFQEFLLIFRSQVVAIGHVTFEFSTDKSLYTYIVAI